MPTPWRRLALVAGGLMPTKDDKFLAGKALGGRPAVVEARINTPVKPHKPKVLTAQEWKFVEEFCAGDGHVTLKEAALRAGYSENWAKGRARELTDPEFSPHIVAAIQERRRELGEKYGTTFERHMRDLQVIRDQALQAGAYGAAVQAEYRRGQALGSIYIDRKEIRHGTIDSMSKDEVMRKLEEIKRVYGGSAGPIVDVTPKQIEEEPDEDENDGIETGSEPVQEAERKPPKLPFHPD
jgi:phage terminase small subunit